MLPDYLAKAKPNPMGNRAPWYANTAPTYAGIFLWIAFYQQMAGGTLQHGGLALCLVALAVAGILSYALYYRVPAMLGMKTGFPLYVVGSSTFGTAGGYVMPGLLMGVLQIGWFAVGTFFSADYILRGLGMASKPGTPAVRNRVRAVGRHDGVCGRQGGAVCVEDRAVFECDSAAHAAGGFLPDLGRDRELPGGCRRSRIRLAHSPR